MGFKHQPVVKMLGLNPGMSAKLTRVADIPCGVNLCVLSYIPRFRKCGGVKCLQRDVTHNSLLFQVSLVSYQHHGEVVSVLHSQDLGVEFLDLVEAFGRRRENY